MTSKSSDSELFPLNQADTETVRGYRAGLWASTDQDELFSVPNKDFAQGVADWWGLPVEALLADLKDGDTCGRALIALTAYHGSPRKPELQAYTKRKHES